LSAWSAVALEASGATTHVTAAVANPLRPVVPATGGNEVLVGGTGDDLMIGGAGRDLLVGGYTAGSREGAVRLDPLVVPAGSSGFPEQLTPDTVDSYFLLSQGDSMDAG
jgi:hypothetical protein